MVSQRPENFRLNIGLSLANGLVLAGLSALPGTTHYHDSSLHSRHGELSNLNETQRWLWSDEIGRFYNRYYGAQQVLLSNALDVPTLPVTIMVIAQNNGAGWERVFSSSSLNPSGCYIHGTYVQFASGGTKVEIGASCSDTLEYQFNSYQTSSDTIVANKWYTIIARINSMRNMEVFVDGVKVSGSPNYTGWVYGGGTGSARIGALMYNTTVYYGYVRVSDVLMWGRALADEEVDTLSNITDRSLGGLLLPPKRKYYAITYHPTTARFLFLKQNNKFLSFTK